MANRERKNELKIYLSDDEQYILEQKVKTSGMKSKSAFLRAKFYTVLSMRLHTVKDTNPQLTLTNIPVIGETTKCNDYGDIG